MVLDLTSQTQEVPQVLLDKKPAMVLEQEPKAKMQDLDQHYNQMTEAAMEETQDIAQLQVLQEQAELAHQPQAQAQDMAAPQDP